MDRIDKEKLKKFKGEVHSLPDNLSISLWVIEFLSKNDLTCFGAAEIANYIVEELGISTTRQAISWALQKATKESLCHKKNHGYMIMKSGQDKLLKLMNIRRVTLFAHGKPVSARIELEKIFSQMSGIIRICDPYVDEGTLDIIYKQFADKKIEIRLLTTQIKGEPQFKRYLGKINSEYPEIELEIRKLKKGVLHDRYIIDNSNFWLSGNSLNHLGNKESFIAELSDAEIYKIVLTTFNSRWQSAKKV